MSDAIWPLYALTVSSPRVSLSYVTDELCAGLAELAAAGIHGPATMPFSEPWTDVAPPELQRNTMRYCWRTRAETSRAQWNILLAAHDSDGRLAGMSSVEADRFATSRTATTGSWLGREYQGRGLGREMRHIALHLIFAGLGAERARTRAWHDNAASLGVTRSLPYTDEGSVQEKRRGRDDTMLSFAMTRPQWETVRRNDIEIGGLGPVREFLGL